MNIRFFILVFSLFNIGNQEDPIIKSIMQKYAETNAHISLYKQITKNKDDGIGEGGDVVSYLHGDSVKLIIETDYWETGKVSSAYYYDNNEIIFVYSIVYRYKVPIYDTSFNMNDNVLEENRFYFNNRKMIRWIDEKKKNIAVGCIEFKEREKGQLQYSSALMRDALKLHTSNNKTVPIKNISK